MLGLEGLDVVRLLERQSDIVETFHQAALEEGIDVEANDAAVRPPDLLARQIDGDGGVRPTRRIVEQLVDLALRQPDRQNAVLEAVVVEDVGEARRDDAAKAEIEQRPGRMLSDEPQPKLSPAIRICALS